MVRGGGNIPMSRTVKRIRMAQRQQGGSDCGLFAIAYAVDLAMGTDPATITYDQRAMRRHLMRSLEQGAITQFPRGTVETVEQVLRQAGDAASGR